MVEYQPRIFLQSLAVKNFEKNGFLNGWNNFEMGEFKKAFYVPK